MLENMAKTRTDCNSNELEPTRMFLVTSQVDVGRQLC